MDELAKVPTEQVNVHAAVQTTCKCTDDIFVRLKSQSSSNCNYEQQASIDKVKDLTIFMTGFTGDVGGYVARSLLARNNTLYCIVRSSINPKLSAKERFVQQCKRLLLFDKHYTNPSTRRIHFIEGDYFQPKLGIATKDWDFLCDNIDLIMSVGCRVELTMPWDKAVNGILKVTNYLIELSLTNKIKPLFVIGSSGSRVALFGKSGYGMCRGYALAKFVDLERLKYFHYTRKHPLKILFLGYLDRHHIGPPNVLHVLHSLFYISFKLGIFPDIKNSWFDYANVEEICEKAFDTISYKNMISIVKNGAHGATTSKIMKNSQLIYGGYAEKKDYANMLGTFKLMKEISPSLKLVSIEEFQEKIENIDWGYGHKKLVDVDNLVNEINLMFWEPPSNNIKGITMPDKEMFIKILKYIKNAPIAQFMNRQSEISPYFNYPWWDNVENNKKTNNNSPMVSKL